jgi:protein SCO1/2
MFRQKRNWVGFVVLAFLALALGLYLSPKQSPSLSKLHGTALQNPREIEAFSLAGTNVPIFDNKALQGKWTMIFFGFTNCGYLCPTTMAELGKMYKILEQKEVKPLPQVLMISIDPERDSLDKLKDYVTSFDPHFYAARGDAKDIQKMTKELGVAYAKVNVPGQETYDIQHSGTVMLFNPKGKLSAFFTSPHQAALLAEDYTALTKQ